MSSLVSSQNEKDDSANDKKNDQDKNDDDSNHFAIQR